MPRGSRPASSGRRKRPGRGAHRRAARARRASPEASRQAQDRGPSRAPPSVARRASRWYRRSASVCRDSLSAAGSPNVSDKARACDGCRHSCSAQLGRNLRPARGHRDRAASPQRLVQATQDRRPQRRLGCRSQTVDQESDRLRRSQGGDAAGEERSDHRNACFRLPAPARGRDRPARAARQRTRAYTANSGRPRPRHAPAEPGRSAAGHRAADAGGRGQVEPDDGRRIGPRQLGKPRQGIFRRRRLLAQELNGPGTNIRIFHPRAPSRRFARQTSR